MTDAELKGKMEERQMCEEAPGVINTAFIYYDHQDDHQPDLCLIIITIIIITITTLDI